MSLKMKKSGWQGRYAIMQEQLTCCHSLGQVSQEAVHDGQDPVVQKERKRSNVR